MKIAEAKAECERWLKHLDGQREKAEAMQRIASERRAGNLSQEDARRKVAALDDQRSLRVFDAGKLEVAVRTLLKHVR